jgi:hypothetical protein
MEQCQRCKEVDYDRRSLWMSCFYEMDELGLPFNKIQLEDRQFYTLRVCKNCRADWLSQIKNWFNSFEPKKECGSGIFVRNHGVAVEITQEEWDAQNSKHEPVRVTQKEPNHG